MVGQFLQNKIPCPQEKKVITKTHRVKSLFFLNLPKSSVGTIFGGRYKYQSAVNKQYFIFGLNVMQFSNK